MDMDLAFKFGLTPAADAFAGTKNATTINMKLYGVVHALILKGTGTTGTSTITVEKCSASDGTGAEAIPFLYRRIQTNGTVGAWTQAAATGFTTTAGSDEIYEVVINGAAEGMAEGDKPYARITGVEVVDSPVAGGVLYLAHGGRYGGLGAV